MVTLELSMIVKDGGSDLARCLDSVAPFVDRMVVGDTGSSDDSRRIARAVGAEVIEVPWRQDFAQARNEVLRHRKCDWILVLDADEMIDTLSGKNLRDAIRKTHIIACHHAKWDYVTGSIARIGYEAARKNPLRLEASRPYPAYVPTPIVRVFRNHPQIYFEGCVHETILHRLAALSLPAAAADIVLHHFGFVHDSEVARRSKTQLYHALGEIKLQRTPRDVPALIEVGLSYFEHHKNPEAALGYFSQAVAINSACAAAWLFAGACLTRLGRPDEALIHLGQAKQLGICSGVLSQAEGDAYFQKGEFARASQEYAQIDERGEATPLTEAKRGACEVHLGEAKAGLDRIQQAVQAAPRLAELYDILATAAMLAGRYDLAVEAMQARVPLGNLTDFHHQIVALLQAESQAPSSRV